MTSDAVLALGKDVWAWRTRFMPRPADDMMRELRPDGWRADWSPSSVERQHIGLAELADRHSTLNADPAGADEIDLALIGVVLARARFELEVLRPFACNPHWYVEQAVGPIFDLLIVPGQVDALKAEQLVARLEEIPSILLAAPRNLSEARRPFAVAAIGCNADSRLQSAITAVSVNLPEPTRRTAMHRLGAAVDALSSSSLWIARRISLMRATTGIGRDSYERFLAEVALLGEPLDELIAAAAAPVVLMASWRSRG